MISNIWIRYFHLSIVQERWAKTPICVLKFFFENVQFCLRVFSRDPLNLRCRKLRVRDTRKKATFLALFLSSFFCNPIDLRFPAKLQKIIHCQDIQLQVHSWRLREAELANRTSNSSPFYSFSVVLFDRESSWSDRYEALTSFSQSRINLYLDLP